MAAQCRRVTFSLSGCLTSYPASTSSLQRSRIPNLVGAHRQNTPTMTDTRAEQPPECSGAPPHTGQLTDSSEQQQQQRGVSPTEAHRQVCAAFQFSSLFPSNLCSKETKEWSPCCSNTGLFVHSTTFVNRCANILIKYLSVAESSRWSQLLVQNGAHMVFRVITVGQRTRTGDFLLQKKLQLFKRSRSRHVWHETSHHLLRGLHDVPAAAVVHVWPFLRLLAEVHRLLCAFGKRRHEGVRRARPVTVRMTRVSMVTAVTLQHIQHANTELVQRNVGTLNRKPTVAVLVRVGDAVIWGRRMSNVMHRV